VTAGFWESTRAHRLSVQRCGSCERLVHPPSLRCPFCGADGLAYAVVSGRGSLYSYTVVHDPPGPGFRDLVPLVVGLIELEEQPRLFIVSNVVDTGADQLATGLPLEVTFEDGPECTLPLFRPARR
jgi:uncharacterized OB-fold protein